MKLFFYKGIGSFLAILGLVVGFSSKVIAQYGAPPAAFRINGTITSEVCHTPINKVQVIVKSDFSDRVDTLYTNSKGEYSARLYSFDDYSDNIHKVTLATFDKDGSANGGSFSPEQKTVTIKAYESLVLDFSLKHLDVPPCLTNPPVEKNPLPTNELPLPNKNSSLPLLQPQKIGKILKEDEFTLYPNPITTQFTIEFTSKNITNTTLSISNDIGAVVFVQQFTSLKGAQKVTVNSLNLTSGNYIISLIQGASILTKKIIIR